MSVYLIAVVILMALAVSDLIVGVSNDAVNFLNSSIGSRVAPRYFIMIIASLGMLAGVTFSSGMMEVARKGIFHPEFFTMPDLMVMFLAVMLTDIILLDMFNTFGLPTSTTVSIVFELLGSAVAVSLIKISRSHESFSSLVKYINTAKALAIISGILLSVIVAFLAGAVIQFFSRLLFTFDYQPRLKKYGALWGGAALASIVYFILIKGAKGSAFVTADMLGWIKNHTLLILLLVFAACALFLYVLMLLFRINILKLIVLVGTFALALAFAANDLVNFIGVPLASLSAFRVAGSSGNPLSVSMEALRNPVHSHTALLLVAGLVMVVTLWVSRKARSVTKTEISLGRQEEGVERFEASPLSRTIVRMVTSFNDTALKIIPRKISDFISRRLDQNQYSPQDIREGERPCFDLVRASVNLMVASALISIGTSLKLPLSTTYVTFMVAMGSSFSDRAWGRDSAVYRITGVLTVIGGWFFTAFMAFTVSALIALGIFYWRIPAVIVLLGLVVFLVVRNFYLHRHRESESEELEVFNLKKVKNLDYAIDTCFEHAGIFLAKISSCMKRAFSALAASDRFRLKVLRRESKKLQIWSNIIIANIFKALRLMQQDDLDTTHRYAEAVEALQEITESQRDLILRAYTHTLNNHKPLLEVQIKELEQMQEIIIRVLDITSDRLIKKVPAADGRVAELKADLQKLKKRFNKKQVTRIHNESSKTRLSILYYGFVSDYQLIVENTMSLLKLFEIFASRKKNFPEDHRED